VAANVGVAAVAPQSLAVFRLFLRAHCLDFDHLGHLDRLDHLDRLVGAPYRLILSSPGSVPVTALSSCPERVRL
jgi:hypothetical protein